MRNDFVSACRWLAVLGALACAPLFAQAPPAGAPGAGAPGAGPAAGAPGVGPPPDTPSRVQGKASYPGGITALLNVPYATIAGFRPLQLDLYYSPSGRKARPAVVWVHGGGWGFGNARMVTGLFGPWDEVLARLAARGYVVLGVDYRLDGEAKFPAAVQDVKAAIRWARANAAKYHIDPDRVAVWGESAGGQIAALVGTSCGVPQLEGTGGNAGESSCVQAAVDWYGPTDIGQMDAMQTLPNAMKHGGATSSESAYLGCEVDHCPASTLRLANPISFVSAKSPPFLIMHGDSDTGVPWRGSKALYDALRAAGRPATFVLVPGANHIFAGITQAKAQQLLQQVFGFLDSTFGGKPK